MFRVAQNFRQAFSLCASLAFLTANYWILRPTGFLTKAHIASSILANLVERISSHCLGLDRDKSFHIARFHCKNIVISLHVDHVEQ